MITKVCALVTSALILSVASVTAATQKPPRQNNLHSRPGFTTVSFQNKSRPAATTVSFQNNWNVSY